MRRVRSIAAAAGAFLGLSVLTAPGAAADNHVILQVPTAALSHALDYEWAAYGSKPQIFQIGSDAKKLHVTLPTGVLDYIHDATYTLIANNGDGSVGTDEIDVPKDQQQFDITLPADKGEWKRSEITRWTLHINYVDVTDTYSVGSEMRYTHGSTQIHVRMDPGLAGGPSTVDLNLDDGRSGFDGQNRQVGLQSDWAMRNIGFEGLMGGDAHHGPAGFDGTGVLEPGQTITLEAWAGFFTDALRDTDDGVRFGDCGVGKQLPSAVSDDGASLTFTIPANLNPKRNRECDYINISFHTGPSTSTTGEAYYPYGQDILIDPRWEFLTPTKLPSITGTARVGQRLTANHATFTPAPALYYDTDWYRDGKVVGNGDSYVLTSKDLGKKITIQDKVNRPNYVDTFSLHSAPVTVQAGSAPKATTAPKISGAAQVGKALTVTHGSWTPAPSNYTYQWYRNGAAITGATKTTYTATASDRGQKLTVKVTAKLAGHSDGTATTAATAAVKSGAAPKATTAPSISGTKTVGSTLTAHHGTWSPTPTSYTYQWYRNGAAITGATKTTYLLTKSDRAHDITVKVTAKKSGYTSGTATTKAAHIS